MYDHHTFSSAEEVDQLFRHYHIDRKVTHAEKLSGTTSGVVWKAVTQSGEAYIVKQDHPEQLEAVQQFLDTHKNSKLLPDVLFAAEDRSCFAYVFIEGTTHFNRGLKREWMAVLIRELLHSYQPHQNLRAGAWVPHSQESWKAFNLAGIEEARSNIGDALSSEDHEQVMEQAEKLFEDNLAGVEQFFLHGDTGVHNFVFDKSALIGVIDPSPMIGPLLYDFLYAFCSSPDDIDMETLEYCAAFLEQGKADISRLWEETLIQLYCRIGICIKHHPHDLPGYLQAWEEWKNESSQQGERERWNA
ncbi:phosphotransferase [Saccharibacillus endophyticus]|uniref:Aminoglycoside phosphotransferase n=1 Tax=Saccharibacillus endophyticus TaxID=2060666 RepID=A0ABQ1ZL32_9BACL|nr:phosphotransferase [Saccharibacillus endophyticus]GGH68372.1 aminoglycoside phosphotransferase [Saccharibacillus endophyticus]